MEDDAFAEQGEAGAAVHLALDHLDLGDVAFEGGGAVGQCQPGGDGLLVEADAPGEGVQVGLVIGFDGGEPVVECEQALAAGHHLGEAADAGGQAVQVRAAVLQAGELGLFLCVPKTLSMSCGQAIFVDQAIAASLFSDAVLAKIDWFG